MQVILLEKLANLGQLGDVVKVKDGYGRNFLIPQKKAKRATDQPTWLNSRPAAPNWKKCRLKFWRRRKPVPRKSTA